MHFAFTPEQLDLRDGLRELLVDVCPSEVVRAAWIGVPSPVPQLWKQLGSVGLLSLLGPERLGGMGCSEIELALLLEECGRFAVPGPLGEHVAIGVPALAAAGAPEAVAAMAGDAVVTALEPESHRLRWMGQADLVVCPFGDELRLASSADFEVIDELPSVDRSVPSAIVAIGQSCVLTGAEATLARRRATLASAAQLIGLADHVIAMTTEYVKARTQFGVPVGSQQAVKHLLATALIAVEHARPVVYRAGWVLAAGADEPDLATSFAKVYAARAANLAARTALQCHGAIGYSWEHDLHMWMKRVWTLSTAWGTTEAHEEIVAATLLDRASA